MDTRDDRFHRQVDRRMEEFDREFEGVKHAQARAARWFLVWWACCALLGIASSAFVVWVVVILLRFVGAI